MQLLNLIHYVMYSEEKNHESPLTGKNPNQINLQHSTYSSFHCQWAEKVKASTWLSTATTKKTNENFALLMIFFFLFEQPLGLIMAGSFAGPWSMECSSYKLLSHKVQTPHQNAACLSSCHRQASRCIYLEWAFLIALSLASKSDMPVKCNQILIKSLHFCTAKHLSTCLTSAVCLCFINICLWFSFSELRPTKLIQATTIFFKSRAGNSHWCFLNFLSKLCLFSKLTDVGITLLVLPVLSWNKFQLFFLFTAQHVLNAGTILWKPKQHTGRRHSR